MSLNTCILDGSGLANKHHHNIPWNSAEIGRDRQVSPAWLQRVSRPAITFYDFGCSNPSFGVAAISMLFHWDGSIFTLQLDFQKTKAWPLLWRNHLKPEKIVGLLSYRDFLLEHLLPMSASNSQQSGTPTCSMRPCRVSSRHRMANLCKPIRFFSAHFCLSLSLSLCLSCLPESHWEMQIWWAVFTLPKTNIASYKMIVGRLLSLFGAGGPFFDALSLAAVMDHSFQASGALRSWEVPSFDDAKKLFIFPSSRSKRTKKHCTFDLFIFIIYVFKDCLDWLSPCLVVVWWANFLGGFVKVLFDWVEFWRGGDPGSDSDDQGMHSVNALKQSAFQYKSMAFPDVSICQMDWCYDVASSFAKAPLIVKLLKSWKLCSYFLKYLH